MTAVDSHGFEIGTRKAVGLYYRPNICGGQNNHRTIQLEFPTFRWKGTRLSEKRTTPSEDEVWRLEASTLVLPRGDRIPGHVEGYTEVEMREKLSRATKKNIDYVISSEYSKLHEMMTQVLVNQAAEKASNRAEAEEMRSTMNNIRNAMAAWKQAASEMPTKPSSSAPIKHKRKMRQAGKKHTLTGKDKYRVGNMARKIMFQRREKGEPPPINSQVIEQVIKRIETDPTLHGRILPSIRTWQYWMKKYVRAKRLLPGAHP